MGCCWMNSAPSSSRSWFRGYGTATIGGVVLEASGIQPEQLQAYAATGIDLISTSAPVTRSRWLDFSMRFT